MITECLFDKQLTSFYGCVNLDIKKTIESRPSEVNNTLGMSQYNQNIKSK